MEKSSFIPGCIDKVKKLASQEDTLSTLLSIHKDEATSRVEETTAQAFEVETDEESPKGGSDGDGTDLDYEDLDGVTVLSDADEAANQTADTNPVEIGYHPLNVQTSSPGDTDDDSVINSQETIEDSTKGKKSSGP